MAFHRDSPYLRAAVASVLTQTWRDFELVLVDNGTALSATDVGVSPSDPRIRWVRLPRNEGIPAAHNAGVAAARGQWIALQDYDDVSLPDRLAAQVDALEANPGLGLVASRARRIDAEEREVGELFALRRGDQHALYAPYGGPLVLPAAMGPREVFASVPYRAEFPFAADLDFQARVTERWPTQMLSAFHLRYRTYAEQTTHVRWAAIQQSRCVIQLAALRRRSGQAEGWSELQPLLTLPSAAETWRRGAALCLKRGYWLEAAFQARRSFACERTPVAAVQALRLALAAWRQAPAPQRAGVARMFFTGPVRALRLERW